jgi:hypothetical protein
MSFGMSLRPLLLPARLTNIELDDGYVVEFQHIHKLAPGMFNLSRETVLLVDNPLWVLVLWNINLNLSCQYSCITFGSCSPFVWLVSSSLLHVTVQLHAH